MLCGKCLEKIKQGEEVQVKGSIFCQKCTPGMESAGRCNNCFKVIYKDEITHEVYEKWGVESSEKLIKCHSCYKEWLKIAKSKREIWEAARWFENSFLPFIMWSMLAIITFSKNKEYVGWTPFFIVLMLIITSTLLSPFFSVFLRKIIEIKYRNTKKKTKISIKKS